MNQDQSSTEFKIIYTKRKTMALIVRVDQSVEVRVPRLARLATIERFVDSKRHWIDKQRRYFQQTKASAKPLEYSDGTLLPYLGQHYVLKLCAGDTDGVVLDHRRLTVTCNEPQQTHQIQHRLQTWYFAKAKQIFAQRYAQCWQRFKRYHPHQPKLRIRSMKTRWGSFSQQTFTVTLNSELIKTPMDCIDYVIMHEFCHILHRYHDGNFYRLMDVTYPNWNHCRKILNK